MAAVDPNLEFKNDQVSSFRRLDRYAVQLDDITLSAAREYLDMVAIDGAIPDGAKVCAGLVEDTGGLLNGHVGPTLVQRALIQMVVEDVAGLTAGEQVVAVTDVTVRGFDPAADDPKLRCGTCVRTAANAAVTLVMFSAMGI